MTRQSAPPAPEAPTVAAVPERTAESRDEAPPEPPLQPNPPAVVPRKKAATAAAVAKTQVPVSEARLQPSASAEVGANGPFPTPTASPVASQVTPSSPLAPSTPNTAAFSRPTAAEPPQDPQASQQPHVVTLPAGTTLTVRLRESLNSDRSNSGDPFQATLDAPVVADGFVIAERQSKVLGKVIQSMRAGRVKGLANLTLAVAEINTTDGQRLAVQTDSYEKWGNSSGRGDTAKVASGAALGAIIGAIAGGGKGAAIGAGAGGAAGTGIALGTRGASVSVPSESVITFRLARPVTITEKFN